VSGYRHVLASVVGDRDGMSFELWTSTEADLVTGRPSPAQGDQWLAEVFEDDETKARTLTVFTDQPIPLAIFESFLSAARRDL
jgi:hypothetical protein